MKRIVLGGFLLAFFMLCGCQPTPEEPVVINKNDGELEKTITDANPAEEESAAKMEFPKEWKNRYEENGGSVIINVDAETEGTDLSQYPVVEVEAVKNFTEKEMKEFIDFFAKDKKLFVAAETKAEVEERLIMAMRGDEVDGEYVPPQSDDPFIESLKEQLATIPADERVYYSDIELMPTDGYLCFSAGAELDEDNEAFFTITAECYGYERSGMVFSRGMVIDEHIAELNDITLEQPAISEQEAIAMAENAIAALGYSNMQLSDIGIAELSPAGEGLFAGVRSDYSSNGYIMVFNRNIRGMQMVDISESGSFSYVSSEAEKQDEMYRAPWYPEQIVVYADENGIQRFVYSNSVKEVAMLNENVPLLTFEEISDRAAKQLFYENAWAEKAGTQIELNVDRAILGGALINKKDEPDRGLIVPAWYLFYEQKVNGEVADEKVLVLNAIDGSVIQLIY